MDFAQELTVFPSAVHRSIYFDARGLTPLARSLPGVADPALRASCEAYHRFTLDMLSDMYDDPEAYHLPAMELEKYLDGGKLNGVKQKRPARTKDILARTRNAVHGYRVLLCMLALAGTPRGDALAVSQRDIPAISKRVNSAVSPIPLEKRLEALRRFGLVQTDDGFRSERHPELFPAMCALSKNTGGKLSGFEFFAFCNAEFRTLKAKYKPSPEDYFEPLVRERREAALALDAIAAQNGLRPAINTFWKVDYKYKGVQVLCVNSYEGDLDIRVTETYHWDDPALINDRLAREPTEFQRYALRHVWRCDACATTHLGRFVTVLGKRQRVCGGGVIGFRWRNPSGEDIPAIERLIHLRCGIVDELKAKGTLRIEKEG